MENFYQIYRLPFVSFSKASSFMTFILSSGALRDQQDFWRISFWLSKLSADKGSFDSQKLSLGFHSRYG